MIPNPSFNFGYNGANIYDVCPQLRNNTDIGEIFDIEELKMK